MKTILPLLILAAAALPARAADEAAAPAAAPEAAAAKAALAEAAPTADAKASLAKAAAWLAAQQKEDGSFSDPKFPGLSAIALWALVGADDPAYAPAIAKATDYILSCAQPDGGIYRPVPGRAGGGLSTYNTALALSALSFTRRSDEPFVAVVLKARSFLAGSQLEGDDQFAGGFGYDKSAPHRYADLNNTAFVLEAMARTRSYEDLRPAGEKKADIDWDAALAYAESLHNGPNAGENAGGFAYSHADAKAGTEKDADGKVILRSYGSITYSGLLALVYCRLDRADARVQSALDWASRHWTVDENPGVGDQGLYFFYDIISRALTVAGLDSIPRSGEAAGGAPIDWRAELVAKVVSLQREDGSWVNANGRFWENDPVLATSYSAISLAFASGGLR
jgi:squalene-hopene/tetraprenyl-beta-curcumene cyclase